MKLNTLKSTTAMVLSLSLLQPLPSMAQSENESPADASGDPLAIQPSNEKIDLRPPAVICAEAGITDPLECALFIETLNATNAAQAAADAATTEAAQALERQNALDAAAQADEAARLLEEDLLAKEAAEQAAIEAAAEAQAAADAETAADATRNDAATAAAIAAEADAQAAAAEAAQADSDALAISEAETAAQAAADAVAAEAPEAAVAATDPDALAPDNVTSEVITEQTQRSSDEEFRDPAQTQADAQIPNQAPAVATESSDNGLSDLEKAGLLALGAVVVGAILTNGQRVTERTGDRVILVDDDGVYSVLKDDDALLRVPGSEVQTQRYADGSTQTEVTRADGTKIITVRDINGRALRRVRIEPDGREYLLIDDTATFAPVIVRDLPQPGFDTIEYQPSADPDALRLALLAADRQDLGRSFSLRQVRDIVEVRALAPEINLGGITFATNSAAIPPAQAERLREMGVLMRNLIRDDPRELFLVEGHTDAVGAAGYNLLLSDRRAESVALAFSEYFGVGPENIVVQGYGERFLKVQTQRADETNRRVAVRRITALLRTN